MTAQFAKRKYALLGRTFHRRTPRLPNVDPDPNTRPTTAPTQLGQTIGNYFGTVVVEAESIDQRMLFRITKNSRTRIPRLRLRRYRSDLDKRKSQCFPRWKRASILVQHGCKLNAMPESQSEGRHPDSLGGRSRT